MSFELSQTEKATSDHSGKIADKIIIKRVTVHFIFLVSSGRKKNNTYQNTVKGNLDLQYNCSKFTLKVS